MIKKNENGKVILEQEFEETSLEASPYASEATKYRDINKFEQNVAKNTKENILRNAQEIENKLSQLSPEEQHTAIDEIARNKWGISGEFFESKAAWLSEHPELPLSSIFGAQGLGWLPISEMLQRVTLDFAKFSKYIPTKTVENGLHRIFYRDFRQVDYRSAYSQADYQFDPIHNPLGGIATEEIWPVFRNIHMGFTMWDDMLNQTTRTPALFMAILNEFEWNVMKPVAVEFYRLQLRLIAGGIDVGSFPLEDESGTMAGVDFTKLPVDIEIQGNNDYDALTKFAAWMKGLNQPSRSNMPARYNPVGMTKNLMTQYNMNDYVLVCPNDFETYWETTMKSGRFNDQYLNVLPELVGIDYAKSFGEFNGDTGFRTTYQDADLFLVPKATEDKGAWIISQYEATKSMPNLNLTSVTHFWTLVGYAIHRESPIFHIHFTSAKPGDGTIVAGPKGDTGAQGPKGDKGDTGAKGDKGDTGAPGEVTTAAMNTAIDAKVGVLSTLTTTAKGNAVAAINELNEKKADKPAK